MKRTLLYSPSGEIRFFASANSQNGFRNDFPLCFGDNSGISVLYILKGGPGTGKSHFLRTVGRYAQADGYETVYYLCSSDPSSLDGVIITGQGKRMGFLDGTTPHAWEPELPGAREEIINLGAFWDGEKLRKRQQEIRQLDHAKNACYEEAYHYLHACGDIGVAVENQCAPFIRNERLLSLAKRLLKEEKPGKGYQETPAYLACVGMAGCGYLDTYEILSKAVGGEIIYMDECYGLAYELTSSLRAVSKQKGLSCLVSYHPIYTRRINGLYYPDSGLCIIVGNGEPPARPHRYLSLNRYFETDFRTVRSKIRHSLKLSEGLLECACQSLAKAGEYHFELEKIYAEAMDFKAKNDYETAFCKQMFMKA